LFCALVDYAVIVSLESDTNSETAACFVVCHIVCAFLCLITSDSV
jgi:hypothetical protein